MAQVNRDYKTRYTTIDSGRYHVYSTGIMYSGKPPVEATQCDHRCLMGYNNGVLVFFRFRRKKIHWIQFAVHRDYTVHDVRACARLFSAFLHAPPWTDQPAEAQEIMRVYLVRLPMTGSMHRFQRYKRKKAQREKLQRFDTALCKTAPTTST